MAGLRGNQAYLAFQQQTAKGTPATASKTKAIKSAITGGVISPVREIARLSETDAKRDQGVAYVKKDGLKGNPDIYVRGNATAALLLGCLGKDTVTGSTAPFVHTLKPEETLPYWTVWTMLGGTAGGTATLLEEHQNCIFSDVNFKAAAGSPLTATASLLGTTTKRLTAEVAEIAATPQENSTAYTFNMAEIELGEGTGTLGTAGTATTHLVSSFDLNIQNTAVEQQTDSTVPFDIAIGKRAITLGFELFFENTEEYNRFHYGGPTGTAISPNIYETVAKFKFKIGTGETIEFYLPHIAYEEFPVQANPEGNPINVAVKAVGQRSSEDIIKCKVENSQKEFG
jgi:hypothetical protein